MAETVLLLPGQGGYTPGIFAGESDPEVAEVLRVVDRVAGEFGHPGVSGLLTEPDAPGAAELVRTDSFALQLAVFAAGVGGFRLALRQYTPDLVVGHSMGEIAALTVAGAFDLADGARLVCHRSRALSAYCPEPGGMVALGLPARRAAHLVGVADRPGLAVAVANAPRQTVVAGPEAALATVTALAAALEVPVTRLNAPFPFHSPMLALAAEAFAGEIGDVRQRPLRLPVLSPVAGGSVDDGTDLKALLVRQLTAPVQFLAAVRDLHAAGARTFVECGRAGLSGLVRRTVPEVVTVTVTAGSAGSVGPVGTETGGVAAVAAVAVVPAQAVPVAAVAASVVPAPAVSASVVPSAVVPVAVVPVVEAAPVGVGVVLEELRELYAVTLGYPVEAITGEADLEADLGIDSLKRAEMLGKVTAHFGLHGSSDDVRFIAMPTLAELAELVAETLREQSPGAPVAAAPPASVVPAPAVSASVVPSAVVPVAVVPVVEAAPVGVGVVLEELRELYAVTLGYPVEAITGEADLEADLGIDSLKRAEMLGKVTAHFGLHGSSDDVRFIAMPTLAELAELVVATLSTAR
ncbi:ACP S-malonyltransferase [Kitasatospora indigofera]|uniref:ACP S-malonyltransferase n=1 Tax=Kitasatospora indigofera TaxID=67307 RepID=UPI00362F82FE